MGDFYDHDGSAHSSQESFTNFLLRPWSYTSEASFQPVPEMGAINDGDETARVASRESSSDRAVSPSRHDDGRTVKGPTSRWQDLMLFDRSLRLMAALTSVYAFVMTIVSATNIKALLDRQNNGSTSVAFKQKTTCENLEKTEVVGSMFLPKIYGNVLGHTTRYQYRGYHHTRNVEHLSTTCDISEC